MGSIKIRGKTIKPGSRELITVPVTKDLGCDVEIKAHVLAGAEEGPTLLLLSMLHGNEWFSVIILKNLLQRIDVSKLKGNIIAVPVVNAPAFLTGTRCILDDSDEPDANRSFNGDFSWLTNQITNAVDDNFMQISDFIIDYHVSDWGSTMADISYAQDYNDDSLNLKSKKLAQAYGHPILHALKINSKFPGPRSSIAYAGIKYNVPGIVAEIGGLGFGQELEDEWLEKNIQGTQGVMKYLGMLEGTPDFCSEYLLVNDRWRLSPKNGGYLEVSVGLDRQFTQVEKGEVLGKLISPTTFEVLEELKSPGKGILFYMCRSYMVRPGGWAFGIANIEEDISYWEKY